MCLLFSPSVPLCFLTPSLSACLLIRGTCPRRVSWRPFPYMKKAHEFGKNSSTHGADFQILPTHTTVSPESRTELGAHRPFGEGGWTCACPTLYQDPYQGVPHPSPRPSRPVYNLFPAYLRVLSSHYLTLPSSSSLPTLNHTMCWLSYPGYATSLFLYLKFTYHVPFACLMPTHSSYLSMCVIASG